MTKWITKKWTVLTSLFGLWIIFTVVYAAKFVVVPPGSSATFEAVKFIFLSISAFGVLFSTLLASFNSLEASQNIQDRIKFDRIENAFEYMRRWDSPSLKEARDWTRKIAREPSRLSPDELCRRIEGDGGEEASGQDLKRSVITMFNFFEEIELSIQAQRVDADILKKAFDIPYAAIYDRFRPWIDRYSNPSQQGNLKQLGRRWTS
jgi:hypothetical protein